jgi:hypothetical protein
MGPPDNGLTPSREGARRVRAVAERAADDMVNGTTGRMLAAWADIFESLIEETSMDKTVDAWRAAGYTRKPTAAELHREALAALPPWTADPLERLEHTLAAHTEVELDAWALYATTCWPPPDDAPAQTGITWADLCVLAAELRAARTEQASHTAVRFGYRYTPGGFTYSMDLQLTESEARAYARALLPRHPQAELARRAAGGPEGPWETVAMDEAE